MSHAFASKVTRSFRNTALLVTTDNSGMVKVFRAVDNRPIATIVELSGEFEVFYPAGNAAHHTTLASAIHAIEEARSFPTKANQRRNYSKIVLTDRAIAMGF